MNIQYPCPQCGKVLTLLSDGVYQCISAEGCGYTGTWVPSPGSIGISVGPSCDPPQHIPERQQPCCPNCGDLLRRGKATLHSGYAWWCEACADRAAWNQTQDARDGKMYPPDAEKAMARLREEVQQREHDKLIRQLIFKARDLSEGIGKCSTPSEMASVYDYIQKDAEEIARIVSELQTR